MPTIYVKARSQSRQLLRATARKTIAVPPSLVTLGAGTAGAQRVLRFLQRMSELGQLRRVQSAIFYDCNETTVSYVQKFLRKFLGKSNQGQGVQVIFPGYIPIHDGFMRDPKRFEQYEGPMERDMESIVSQIGAQSEHSGRLPEAIIEFMSFAGHSIPGGRLHHKLSRAFPNSVLLPVLALPEDHVDKEWTRRYIWEQYENLLDGSNCLVTGLPSGNTGDDDIRLSIGLASFEAAELEEDASAGSQLAAACRRVVRGSSGWLGMATVRRKMPITRQFELLRFPPWWQEYAAVGSEEASSALITDAIWATLESPSQMAPGVKEPYNAPQEVVVSLPVHPDALESIASGAAELLERSDFFGRLPNMDIAFNTARFSEGVSKDPYLNVSRLYPIIGELGPVMEILHPDWEPDDGLESSGYETGFGSYYHLGDPSVIQSLASADQANNDGMQNVRYI